MCSNLNLTNKTQHDLENNSMFKELVSNIVNACPINNFTHVFQRTVMLKYVSLHLNLEKSFY